LKDSRQNIPFPVCNPADLLSNLRLIRGIGPLTETKLREQGFTKITKLIDHPQWGNQARHIHNLIEKHRVKELRKMGAKDHEWLSCFTSGDFLFLDIETTGGLLYYRDDKIVINQFFARHYREEKAALAAT